jgi:hypothetical protein
MAIVAGALLFAVTACASDSKSGVTVKGAEQSETTLATDTTAVDTSAVDTLETTENTEPATTEVSTTDAPETTEAETTEPETTEPASTEPATTESSPPLFPAGWQPFELTAAGVIAPKAEDNWTGVPSPPLPPAGQPLADGIYPADAVAWEPQDPESLGISVQRLDLCTDLPEAACINYGEPYQPTELGVNASTTLPLTIALDDTVGVVMIGYECTSIVKKGNGADLSALYTAFESAYTSTIASQLTPDGSNDQAIIEALTKSPTNGFSGASTDCPENFDSGLVFKNAAAPAILMQTITGFVYNDSTGDYDRPPLTPTSATGLETVEVKDGHMTLYIYAGFFS